MGMSPVTGVEVAHTLRKLEQHVGTIANQMKLAARQSAPVELVECVSGGGWSEQDSAQLKRIADVLEGSLDRAMLKTANFDLLGTLSDQGLKDVLAMVLAKIQSREREEAGLPPLHADD